MWTPANTDDPQIMAEAIGSTSESYLGGAEKVNTIAVSYFHLEARAIVWVQLTDNSFQGQLEAIASFATVRECYDGELELDLRFGEPPAYFEQSEAARAVVHAA